MRASKAVVLALIAISMLTTVIIPSSGSARAEAAGYDYAGPAAPPDGYVHRPIVEFFTGLSCPSCMGGPEQDMEKLLEDAEKDESVPYEVIFFHELNGGGVDALRTEESEERMRHYQPGVSGTPDAEFDGGYIELGGMTSPGGSVEYSNAQNAVDTCATRYETTFNPLHPIQSLRSSFKFVDLEVYQYYSGSSFGVMVNITYLGMNTLNPLLQRTPLNAEVNVFMVEDHVPAFSTVTSKVEDNRNVFRGYAIKAQQITLNMDETTTLTGAWEIPDNLEVPVDPGNVHAVAVVYDLDDVSSQDGTNGNKAQVPRAIQCATPKSTAYDTGNEGPVIKDINAVANGDKVTVSAYIDDKDGVSQAYLVYNTDDSGRNWSSVPMKLGGEELCDEDTGICYAYSAGEATGEFKMPKVKTLTYYIIANDANGAYSVSQRMNSTNEAYSSTGEKSLDLGVDGFSLFMITVGIIAILAVFYMAKKGKLNIEGAPSSTAVIVIAIAVLAVIIGALFYSPLMSQQTSKAPDFEARIVGGGTFQLSDYKGKVVLLDFFSTTCTGCEEAIQELKKVYPDYKDRVVFVSLTVDPQDSDAIMRSYAESHGVQWTMAHVDREVLQKYSITQIPRLFIVDADGNIVYDHTGPEDSEKIANALDMALSGSASPVSISSTSGTVGLVLMGIIAGVGMFFSPCAFPLLPGYISFYLTNENRKRTVGEGLKAGLVASAGIVLVFLIIGVVVGLAGNAVAQYLGILEPIIGVILVIMAILLLMNVTIPTWYITEPVKSWWRKITGKGDAMSAQPSGGNAGLFAYGMGYAAGASSCTAPILVALIFMAMAAGGFMGAFLMFVIFALSMSVLMVIFTVMAAVGGQAVAQKYSGAMKYIEKGSAIVLLIVGLYFIYTYVVLVMG